MGNQQIYDSENILNKFTKSIKKVKSLKKNSYMELDTKSTSYYSGIRNINSDNDFENDDSYEERDRENIHSISSSEEKNKNDFINKDVPVVFEWNEPASAVYLIGNFGNWNQRFIMDKIGDSFKLILVIFFYFTYLS
jgi:hypothetical protein